MSGTADRIAGVSAGTELIADGVYGLIGRGVNAYLLDDPREGLTLIDAGLPGWGRRILALIAEIGRRPSDLRRILITHADVDHIGALAALAASTGSEIAAGERTAGYLASRAIPPHIRFPMTLPVGLINAAIGARGAVAKTLRDGEQLGISGGLRAVATPGHTPDHFSYFLEREGLAFVGDLYRNVDGLELYPRNAWDRAEQEASAKKIEALRPKIICPGHGKVWREGDPRLR
jgi:glyoxylase-like metal-dependent hydrolase (beta-lactamase superfamily II)